MSKRLALWQRTAFLLVCSVSVAGCFTTLPKTDGKVTDLDTGDPIQGAFVVRYLDGNKIRSIVPDAGGRGYCAIAGVTVSDAEGRYRFPSFSTTNIQIDGQEVILAYKPGYRHKEISQQRRQSQRSVNFLWREERRHAYPPELAGKLARVYDSRVLYLNQVVGKQYVCRGDSDVLYPMFKTIYLEALEAAKTSEEERQVTTLCRLALSIMNPTFDELDSRLPCDSSALP
jgi:hypothetical protein